LTRSGKFGGKDRVKCLNAERQKSGSNELVFNIKNDLRNYNRPVAPTLAVHTAALRICRNPHRRIFTEVKRLQAYKGTGPTHLNCCIATNTADTF
jgi:hypothetical protein